MKYSANPDAKNAQKRTCLQEAVFQNKLPVVENLIKKHKVKVDVESNDKTALAIAAEEDYSDILHYLLDNNAKVVVSRVNKADINALGVAIQSRSVDSIIEIIRSDYWKEALRVIKGRENPESAEEIFDTPLRQLIELAPRAALAVFDRCIEYYDDEFYDKDYEEKYKKYKKKHGFKRLRDGNCELSINYEFIDDMNKMLNARKKQMMEKNDEKMKDKLRRKLSFLSPIRSSSSIGCKTDLETALLDEQRLEETIITGSVDLYNNHVLTLIVNKSKKDPEDANELFLHPVIDQYVKEKWNQFGKRKYRYQQLIAIFFTLFMALHLLNTPPQYKFKQDVWPDNCTNTENDLIKSNPLEHSYDIWYNNFLSIEICGYLAAFFGFLGLVKEMEQLGFEKSSYLTEPINYVEIFSYISSFIVVLPVQSCSKPDWQYQLGFYSFMTSWLALINLMELGDFGRFIIMIKSILTTLFEPALLLMFAMFWIAFATGIHLILEDRIDHKTMGDSIFTVFAMVVAGEIEHRANYYPEDGSEVKFPTPVLVLTFAVLLVMNIAMMNLLMGLAISDVDGIINNAESMIHRKRAKFTFERLYMRSVQDFLTGTDPADRVERLQIEAREKKSESSQISEFSKLYEFKKRPRRSFINKVLFRVKQLLKKRVKSVYHRIYIDKKQMNVWRERIELQEKDSRL